MPESTKTSSISTSPTINIKTPNFEKSPSTIIVEKRHFADMHDFFTGQEGQKYNPITSTILIKLI